MGVVRGPATGRAALGALVAALGVLAGGCGTGPGAGGTTSASATFRFGNTVNSPFATVASGPLDALLIEEPSPAQGRVSVREDATHSYAGAQSLHQFLVSVGARPAGSRLLLGRRLIHTRDGELVLHNRDAVIRGLTRAGGGDLTFAYQGWSAATQAELSAFVDAIYPVCVQVYGKPAFSNTVTFVLDDTITDLTGGVYDATANEIRIPSLTDNTDANHVMVVRQLLHAFHDDAMFYYEQWEQGFSVAAADAIVSIHNASYDPSYGSLYVTNLYELLNAPELGHDRIFGTGFDGMITWRLGMAAGAWSKCWVEDPTFFSRFNSAYYARWSADTAAAGNVPVLASIASAVLPSVEGQSFYEWFRRQYALDTSLNVGDRTYIYSLPEHDRLILVIDSFTSTEDGRETARSGGAVLEFFDYTAAFSLYVQEGYEVSIPGVGTDAGQGYYVGSLYNIGGAQRITVTIALGSVQRQLVFPYMVRGETEATGSSILGAAIGRDDGTVSVSINGGSSESITVSQGAFGSRVGGADSSPAKVSLTFTDADGVATTRQVNTGYFFYVVLPSILERETLSHYFATGPSGMHLMSVPGYPVATEDAVALGVDPSKLLMAYWDPSRQDELYEVYPFMPPLVPGRGYWLRVTSPLQVQFEADVIPAGTSHRMYLTPGWNLVGCPFTQKVNVADLAVDDGSGSVSFGQAVQNAWVRGLVFGYTETDGYQEANSLVPWSGYWMYCKVSGVTVTVPNPTAAAASARAGTRSVPEPEWAVRLWAETPSSVPASVLLGAATDATDGFDPQFDVEALPPGPGQRVGMCVTADGAPEGGLSREVRPLVGRAATYAVRVWAAEGSCSLVLHAQGVPPGGRLRVEDAATGAAVASEGPGRFGPLAVSPSPRLLRVIVDLVGP